MVRRTYKGKTLFFRNQKRQPSSATLGFCDFYDDVNGAGQNSEGLGILDHQALGFILTASSAKPSRKPNGIKKTTKSHSKLGFLSRPMRKVVFQKSS